MGIISNFNKNMKLVRESLNEFHQTGDPLGSLNVGVKSEAIEVINFFNRENATHPIPVKSEKDVEELQNMINNCKEGWLLVYFKDPVKNTYYQWNFITFKAVFHDRNDDYQIIKYEGHYFHF